jgi:hypothetical protein
MWAFQNVKSELPNNNLPLKKLQDWYNFFVYLILATIALQNAHIVDNYSFLENIDEHDVTISSGHLVHTSFVLLNHKVFFMLIIFNQKLPRHWVPCSIGFSIFLFIKYDDNVRGKTLACPSLYLLKLKISWNQWYKNMT